MRRWLQGWGYVGAAGGAVEYEDGYGRWAVAARQRAWQASLPGRRPPRVAEEEDTGGGGLVLDGWAEAVGEEEMLPVVAAAARLLLALHVRGAPGLTLPATALTTTPTATPTATPTRTAEVGCVGEMATLDGLFALFPLCASGPGGPAEDAQGRYNPLGDFIRLGGGGGGDDGVGLTVGMLMTAAVSTDILRWFTCVDGSGGGTAVGPGGPFTYTRGWLRRALSLRVETAAGEYPPLSTTDEDTRRRVHGYMDRLT